MAQLQKPEPLSGFNIDSICPAGQYVAVCLEVQDLFGVTRRKFQSEETEQKDITRFLFGVLDQTGRPYLIQTFEMTIASTPGSNLIKFLTAWLGKPPAFGWDYCELKGSGAMIAVSNKETKSTPSSVYSVVSGIFPVPPQMVSHVPDPSMFANLVANASQGHSVGGNLPPQPQPAVIQQQYQQPQPLPAPAPAPAPVAYHAPAPVAQPAPAPAPAPVAAPPVAGWDPNAEEEEDIPF